MTVDRGVRKDNNFGALRLFFASLVILSHSPVIITGNEDDDLLFRIFGTVTSGALAVDGFFIVSGYLVTKSFVSTQSMPDYFRKRIFRICPGFIVNYWVCIFVFAPLMGAGLAVLHPNSLARDFVRMLRLGSPGAANALAGMPYPSLNGSAWTIAYEFRCYILVALLGLIGLYKKQYRGVVLAGVIACLVVNALGFLNETSGTSAAIFGSAPRTVRLTGMFGVGTVFYLFEDYIVYDWRIAASVGVVVICSLFSSHLAEFSIAVFGGYLVFWFAFKFKVLALSKFTNRTDLSYGIYLYAWPVQAAIVFFDRSINQWVLSLLALLISAMLAGLSWTLIEKPSLAFAHRNFQLRRVDPVLSSRPRPISAPTSPPRHTT